MGQIPASFPRLVADAFFASSLETISRPFTSAFGPQVSKSTFCSTGVSDCAVPWNHLSVRASPTELAILRENNGRPRLNKHAHFAEASWGAQSVVAGDGIGRDGLTGYANPNTVRWSRQSRGNRVSAIGLLAVSPGGSFPARIAATISGARKATRTRRVA
jgi:hypothetical protein